MGSEKLCPFKKGTVKRWAQSLENNDKPTTFDVLMPCDGERCTAYRGGECRKLPTAASGYSPPKEV